ncbi:MAG: putative RNase H-related nuclease YkuK (DUF458 family) [Sphingobacteriales bacterium]|jgi:predicted RNase H-related nuclease YkuK (DUF458 family)
MIWRKFNGDIILNSIYNEVETIILREKKNDQRLKVCIGTDSQVKGALTHFATVIVFLREHQGGFMLISSEKTSRKMKIKERMLAEVSKSIEIAYQICPLLENYNIELEVHADINTDPNFQSNVALQEAMGYILSMGFVFKAKPDAFASSSCADKYVN